MDIFTNRHFRVNKCLLGIIGLWPYQPQKQRRIQCILIFISIVTVIIVQGFKLLQFWGDLALMVECIVPMGVQVVAIMKSANCISNGVKLKRLMDLMNRDWATMTDKDEVHILITYVKDGCYLGLTYIVIVMGSMVIYLVIPLWPQILDIIIPKNETRPRQFLYHIEYYVDAEEHYTIIMIHNYVGTIFTIVTIVSVDAMLIAYVHHVCGMFTIIGNRLENTMKDAHSDVIADCSLKSDHIHGYITNCIKNHEEILEFARLIEMSVSMSLLFQIAVSMLLVSATGLQLVTNLGKDHEEVFRLGQFILGQLSHLFFNSWPSQMLINHSQRFRDSVYFGEWYRLPLRERHLIRLILLRSLEPCKISAGKLYDLSMESFGKVVQTSLSYFTVLVSLR